MLAIELSSSEVLFLYLNVVQQKIGFSEINNLINI
jgi:hypothetical protein